MSKADSEKTVKWKQKGLCCYDDTESTTFHYLEHFTEEDIKEDRDASFRGGGNFRLPPELSLFCRTETQKPRWITVDKDSIKKEVRPFDFRAFGFGLFGDFDKKMSYYRTVFACMDYGKGTVTIVEPGDPQHPALRRKSIQTFNAGGLVMSIDTERGHWPILAVLDQPAAKRNADGKLVVDGEKRVLLSRCEIDLIEVDGEWVPRRATYSNGRDEYKILLTWKSVNAKPGEIVFSDERFLRLMESEERID